MVNTRLEAAIQALDGARLEQLSADLLRNDDDFAVRPTDTTGPDGGREAELKSGDEEGILHCSVQDDWVSKAKSDAKKAADHGADFFYFVTNQDPSGSKRDRVEEEIQDEHDFRVRVIDFSELRNALSGNRENHHLAREHLSVDISSAFEDPASATDELYEELLERVSNNEAPYGKVSGSYEYKGKRVDGYSIVAVHIIPVESTTPVPDRTAEDMLDIPTIQGLGKQGSIDLGDKIIRGHNLSTPRRFESNDPEWRGYSCFHSDGWVEAVTAGLSLRQDPSTISYLIDPTIVEFVENTMQWYDGMSIYPPYYIYITLLNVEDSEIKKPDRMHGPAMSRSMGDKVLKLPKIVINELEPDIPLLLRKPLYVLWKRGGWNKSIHYTENESEGKKEYEWTPYTESKNIRWLSDRNKQTD